MIAISSPNELEKILKNQLVIQSELNKNSVLNSLSVYGTTLEKILNKQIRDSYTTIDSVIIFELTSRPNSESNVTYENSENNLTYYRAYNLKVMIYGDDSPNVANKLFARLNSEIVKDNLQQLGVNIENITNPESVNEYINDVMWLRNDINIELGCKFEISQVSDETSFDSLSDLKIIIQGE